MRRFGKTALNLAMVMAAAGLAGCSTRSAINSTEPFYIASVDMVGAPPRGASERQLQDLRAKTMTEALRMPATGDPKALRLKVVKFHQKNPVLSYLLTDMNYMKVEGEVREPRSGEVIGRFKTFVIEDNGVDGMVGAALAAVDNRGEVEQRLNNRAAEQILVHVYGSKAWRKAAERKKWAVPRDYARFQKPVAECEREHLAEHHAEVAVMHCVEPLGGKAAGRY